MNINNFNNVNCTPDFLPLDYKKRPAELTNKIANAFDSIVSHDSSHWHWHNGAENEIAGYGMAGVDEYVLMKKIIQQAPSTQKTFTALDIGSGNSQWSEGLVKYLEKQTDLRQDIKVHIISLQGENNKNSKVVELGICKIHNLGTFKIEELSSQFKELGMDMENQVDLIVSRWCFRHLADPVGTFTQAYNLLRPGGFILLDGFLFLNQNDDLNKNGNIRMTQLFFDTKAPFLTLFYDCMRSLNHFILQKHDAEPCQLPMSYRGVESVKRCWRIGSDCVTRFQRESQTVDQFNLPFDYEGLTISGDKAMFTWLKEQEVFSRPEMKWQDL